MRSFILAAATLVLAGCQSCQPAPTPVPPPQPLPVVADAAAPPAPQPVPPSPVLDDAGRKLDPCQKACANEARLKCVSSEASCVSTCRRVVASRLTALPLACIASAKDCKAQAACR